MHSTASISKPIQRHLERPWVLWMILGVGCFLASKLSLMAPVEGQGTALFWLAAGLTLGTLIRLDVSRWPGALATVFVVCVVSNRLHDISWPLSFSFAAANVVEPAVGAALFRTSVDRTGASLVAQSFLLLASGALACAVGGLIGAGALSIAGMSQNFDASFSLWFITDLMGVVVTAPLLLAWWPGSEWAAPDRPLRFAIESIVALAAIALAGYFTFFGESSVESALVSLSAHLALLLACALRLGPRGATLSSLCLSALAAFGTVQGHGPFALTAPDVIGRATGLQSYLVATAFVALVPSLLLTERARAAESLRAREQEVAAIFRSIGEGLIITDRDGRIRYDNAAARRLLGTALGATTGGLFSEVVSVDGTGAGDDVASRVLREGAVIRSGEPRRLLRVDETEVWTILTGAPLLDARGTITGAAIILTDESERRAHAEKLASTERQLAHAQKLRAVGDLAAGVAHDFNNILTAIQGSAQILQFEAREDQKELLSDILDASNKAKQLTSQLSVFNRNDPIEVSSHDLSNVVLGMKNMLSRLLREDIHLSIKPANEPHVVQCDRGQLEQVVVNLAINARDAMPTGGHLEISIAASKRGSDHATTRASAGPDSAPPEEYVVIEVKDSGQGMDQETQSRIFEPFFTTKPSGSGTGLGLATVQTVCERHQGFVRVQSQLGRGSTFSIFLPRVNSMPQTISSTSRVAAQGTGQYILVVEDSRELRAPIQRLLQRKGFRTMIAEDAQHALRLVEAQSYDLLLTDVIMPGMNGKELADRARALCPELPVLFMSGYSDGVLGQRVDGLSGLKLLRKPFTADELTRAVLKAMRPTPPADSTESPRA